MITLTIFHNIFVTDEERLALASGNQVEVMGISVPVWFSEGNTSEPAKEIFCKYILTNQTDDYPPIIFLKGYKLNLPQSPEGLTLSKRPSEEKLSQMTKAEITEWEIKHPRPATSADLLDENLKSIHFKKYSKNIEDGKTIRVVHIVEIKPIEVLENSIL